MALIGNLISPVSTGNEILKVRIFFVATLVAAAVVEIGTAFAAETWSEGLRFLGLNLILGGAAGLVGALIGFIFGIPRALTNEASAQPDGNPQLPENNKKSKTNTNLEQISDWLTKILVGATLASLATVPGFFANW